MSRLSAFSNPAFGLTDSAARTGCRALGLPAPQATPSRAIPPPACSLESCRPASACGLGP